MLIDIDVGLKVVKRRTIVAKEHLLILCPLPDLTGRL
jgi:hypothetical protein